MTGQRLRGKVALITGASSGIGEATALALASEGSAVVLAARRVDRLDALVSKIRQSGGSARAVETDVSDEAAAERMVSVALEAYGRLDVLVCAAGVGVAAPFADTLSDEYRQMVDVNLMGFLYSLKAAAPLFTSQRSGHVVAISSGAGRYFHPSVVYSGTKHAVSAIAESLRREVGQAGVRVSCIDPGAVRSEFLSHMRAEVQASVERRLGDLEQLESQDVAEAVLYAVTRPARVNVNILTLYPTGQA